MRNATNNSRVSLRVVIALAGLFLAIGAAGLSTREADASGTAKTPRPDEVTGEVTLTQSGSDVAPDASRVVVWLAPAGSTASAHAAADRPRYRLVQHNKRFEPSLLV